MGLIIQTEAFEWLDQHTWWSSPFWVHNSNNQHLNDVRKGESARNLSCIEMISFQCRLNPDVFARLRSGRNIPILLESYWNAQHLDTSLLGLLCFTSFCLAILNTKYKSQVPETNPPTSACLMDPLPIIQQPGPFISCLSALYACNVCLSLVGLVACGKWWSIFECYNFVTLMTQAVCLD